MPLHRLDPVTDISPSSFVAVERGGHEVTVTARTDTTTLASTSVERVVADPDVAERTVDGDGYAGWFYDPPGDGPHPGVLVLHGSLSRDLRRYSRMLATNGYAVLHVQYFGESGLPDVLHDMPLEVFDRAGRWLTDREAVHGDRIGVVGYSRGVEPALLTAANFDGRAVIVGYSGSGVVSVGYNSKTDQTVGSDAAWTRGGDPIASADAIDRARSGLPDLEMANIAAAGVPVERIKGPIVLFSGREDRLWRAPLRSEYAIRRLARHDHPHPYAHVTYGGTGHVFLWPYRSYAGKLTREADGGSPDANARAGADSWVRTVGYLERGLRTK